MVLGVNTGERSEPDQQAQKARQFRDNHGLTYPILVDTGDRLMQRYGVMAFPTNLVIDRRGIVRAVETGFDPGSLEQTISSLLNTQAKR